MIVWTVLITLACVATVALFIWGAVRFSDTGGGPFPMPDFFGCFLMLIAIGIVAVVGALLIGKYWL